jgi:recombination protein RecA
VKKSGAWFTYEGEQLGQGRENAKNYLRTNPEVMMEINDKVLIAAGLKEPEGGAEADAVDEFSEADEQPIDLG